LCFLVSLWQPIVLSAGVIYDNGAPDDSAGSGATSDLGGDPTHFTEQQAAS